MAGGHELPFGVGGGFAAEEDLFAALDGVDLAEDGLDDRFAPLVGVSWVGERLLSRGVFAPVDLMPALDAAQLLYHYRRLGIQEDLLMEGLGSEEDLDRQYQRLFEGHHEETRFRAVVDAVAWHLHRARGYNARAVEQALEANLDCYREQGDDGYVSIIQFLSQLAVAYDDELVRAQMLDRFMADGGVRAVVATDLGLHILGGAMALDDTLLKTLKRAARRERRH